MLPPTGVSPFILGKLAPRYDKRTLKLESYMATAPHPPSKSFFQERVNDWGMLGNDKLGDCTCAAAGHMLQQWTAYASAEVHPTEEQIVKAYGDVGGYVPGQPDTDNGAIMLDVLKYWRNFGIAGHQIAAFARVRTDSPLQMRLAASLFGNVYVGIQLPLTAQDQLTTGKVWEVAGPKDSPRGAPGSWGGHAVPIVGYDATKLLCVTWGATKWMSWSFLQTYADEAYAVLTHDWIKQNNVSPSGFNINSLLTDLTTVVQNA